MAVRVVVKLLVRKAALTAVRRAAVAVQMAVLMAAHTHVDLDVQQEQ